MYNEYYNYRFLQELIKGDFSNKERGKRSSCNSKRDFDYGDRDKAHEGQKGIGN